jgi:DNA-binding NtrC family response regulator
VEEDGWTLIRTRPGRRQWLAVATDRALEPRGMAVVKAVAGWLGLADAPAAVVEQAPAPVETEATRFGLVGKSTAFRKVLHTIEHVRANDVSVLLLGESGTGKDVIARAIHRSGRRTQQPFIAVNCAALPPTLLESELFGHERGAFTSAHEKRVGVFERADGGTIFLDEIGEMSQEMQAKLLRVLQDQSFTRVGGTRTIRTDVRVLAATNRDLQAAVDQGRFRTDLFFRLNVVTILLPPLRDRRDDIPLLAQHFLERFAGEFRSPVRSMSREVTACLMEYSWPGNIRELENTIKNMMVFADHATLQLEDLPPHVLRPEPTRPQQSVEDAVRAMIEADDYSEERPLMPRIELLTAHQMVRSVQNKTQAARLLGITKPTLYNRLHRFDALYGDRPFDDGE